MDFVEKVTELLNQEEFFSSAFPIHISRAPGRLDLMGGNDDYTGGLVFESTIKEATYAAAQLRNDTSVVLINETARLAQWDGSIAFQLQELQDEESVKKIVNSSAKRRWTAYVLGNIFYLRKKYPDQVKTGITLYMDSEIPLNRGVSSSAAIEVSVMKSSAAAYGIELKGVELALACQWVENTIAESACGIMDQIAVVTGKANFIMPLVCQPCNPEPLIRLPEELQIWGIDSGVSHQVAGIEYEAARASAFMGYKIICDHLHIPVIYDASAEIGRYTDARWNGYLANLSPALFHAQFASLLPKSSDRQHYLEHHEIHVDPFTPLKDGVQYNILANTQYAVEENFRVKLFSELSRGASLSSSKRAYELMGELMYQSHYAYTECGLGAKATDALIQLCLQEGVSNGIYGAKITGGGAGGTVAILAQKESAATIQKIFESYSKLAYGLPYLFEGSSDGADTYGIREIRPSQTANR